MLYPAAGPEQLDFHKLDFRAACHQISIGNLKDGVNGHEVCTLCVATTALETRIAITAAVLKNLGASGKLLIFPA